MASNGKNTMQGIKAFLSVAEKTDVSNDELSREMSAILSPDALTALKKRSEHGKKAHVSTRRSCSPKHRSNSSQNDPTRGEGSKRIIHRGGVDGDLLTISDLAEDVSSVLGPNILGALAHKDPATIKSSSKKAAAAPAISTDKLKAMQIAKAKLEEDVGLYDDIDEEEIQDKPEKRNGRSSHRKDEKRSHSPKGPTKKTSREKGTDESAATLPKRDTRTRRVESTDRSEPSSRRKSPKRGDPKSKRVHEKRSKELPNHAEDVAIDLEDGLDDFVGELGGGSGDEGGKQRHATKARARKPGRARTQDDGDGGGRGGGRAGRTGRRGRQRNIQQQQLTQMTHVDQAKQFHESDIMDGQSTEEEESEHENDEETEQTYGLGFGILGPSAVLSEGAAVAAAAANLAVGGATGAAGAVYGVASTAGGTMLNVGGLVGGTVYSVLNTAATTTVAAASSTAAALTGHETFEDDESDDDDE
jgi:hypothetical protein